MMKFTVIKKAYFGDNRNEISITSFVGEGKKDGRLTVPDSVASDLVIGKTYQMEIFEYEAEKSGTPDPEDPNVPE